MSDRKSDWAWRLAAILVAVILWIAVGREAVTTHQRTFLVPVRTRHAPNDERIELEPDLVSVRISGERTTLSAITPEDIQAYIDLRDQPNRQLVPIVVSLPTDVTVKEMLPARVRVHIISK